MFRYLSAHPQTCASSVKEPRFFSHHPNPLAADALAEYSVTFRHCKDGCPIVFEASPQYLAGGSIVARSISAAIPNIRLAFILREPADRLMSTYKSDFSRDSVIVRKLSPERFVDKVLATDSLSQEQLSREDVQLQRELYRGRYSLLLAEYLSVFRAERILILFFDELRADPQSFMLKLCEFAEIDSGFYANFQFTIENKTRQYRSTHLNRMVHGMNLFLEPAFNRLPALRNALRRLYVGINERRQKQPDSATASARLNAYYQPHNRELSALMSQSWPEAQLPVWLTREGAPRTDNSREPGYLRSRMAHESPRT